MKKLTFGSCFRLVLVMIFIALITGACGDVSNTATSIDATATTLAQITSTPTAPAVPIATATPNLTPAQPSATPGRPSNTTAPVQSQPATTSANTVSTGSLYATIPYAELMDMYVGKKVVGQLKTNANAVGYTLVKSFSLDPQITECFSATSDPSLSDFAFCSQNAWLPGEAYALVVRRTDKSLVVPDNKGVLRLKAVDIFNAGKSKTALRLTNSDIQLLSPAPY